MNMKLRSLFTVLFCAVMLLACGKEQPVIPEEEGDVNGDVNVEIPEENKPPKEFTELVQAHIDGRIYVSVSHKNGGYYVNFEEDYRIDIPKTAFEIHNCISSAPAKVTHSGNWWTVNGQVIEVEVDSSVSNLEAFPVYVYYDLKTLYMYLSNGSVLKFNSRVLIKEEEEKREQKELERRQTIPVIYIDTKGQPIRDKENYVGGTITIKDPELLYSEVEEQTMSMGIRGRGNSTWGFPKKPYKVKLDSKASVFGMPEDKEWCLLANYTDRTLLRNVVAMRLSSICGFAWTPRMVSVELYLNNKYQGVYTFCEHKKVSSDRVDIDVDAGDVYLEIEQQQDETICWWTGMGVPMMFSDPEEPAADQQNYIKDYFADFEASLYAPDFADPETGYASYIDVDSFIDYFIVQELAKNTDGNLRKSSFITKEVGKKMEMYHLWDFDLTFGNSGWVMHDPVGWWIKDYKPDCTIGDNWFNRMFQDPAFVAKVKARWEELLPQLREIPDFIDKQALYLDKAKDRNFTVWDINASVDWVECPSLGSYQKEVDFLKEFYTKRVSWMTNALKNM